MKFIVAADTDIGITKENNQDSILVKHGKYQDEEILMAIICDGMGGLESGELASATVIQQFNRWFTEELPYELDNLDTLVIGAKWKLLLQESNIKMMEYSRQRAIKMGTTFTGVLFIKNTYIVVHVGDTRLYHIGERVEQLTEDQTVVAREVTRGTITKEEAKVDKRRNILLQCVGASENLEPIVKFGELKKGTYMLCSDGFRHEITEQEMYNMFHLEILDTIDTMLLNTRCLIDLAKQRMERDNISVVLIKVE